MPYARLRKEWAKKNFNLPALPENSPLAEHLFHELNKLDSLQREAQRTRAALTSKERRGIIHYELNKDSYRLYQDHLAWPSKAQKAHAKLIQQSDAIGIRAADAEKDIISELKSPAIQDAIQKELNQLEKQKGEKNNQKTEEEKKANHEVITAAIVKEIAVIDAQIKQLKSFLDDLAQENKEPNIIKSIKEFTRDQLRIGSDPGSLVTADDDNEVINWVKGGKKREAAANGVFKSFRKYKVGNKTFKAEYEDSADGTKFLLAATHMKKKGKWGLNNPEYWGKKERKGRINVDYEKMVMEGYKTYSLDEGYGQSDNSAKRWQEKNIQETADYMRTLAAKEIIAARSGEEFKDHLPTFKQPIQVMEGLAENQRTSGYARRLNTLIRLNNEVETQNAELSGLKLDQISRLASTRGTKTVKQIIATKNSVIAARHVAALARDLVALALDKISIHYSGAHNSAKVLEALTSACRDAQEAYSMAHAEIEHAKKELERQKGLLRPEHPDLVALEAEIKHAEEKLGEALAAITRARNSVIAMTKIPADKDAESLQDAITLKPEVMTILAKVIATDMNSVERIANVLVDAEEYFSSISGGSFTRSARLDEVVRVLKTGNQDSVDSINKALALDPEEVMDVLNDAHHAIASRLAPEMNERIVNMLDTVENAGARLVSLNEEAAAASAKVLAGSGNTVSARAVLTHDSSIVAAAVSVLEGDGHEVNAAKVLRANNSFGSDLIAKDTSCLTAVLKVSEAGRNFIVADNDSVLNVLKISGIGQSILAKNATSCAAVAMVDASSTAGFLQDDITSATKVLLANNFGLSSIAESQEGFLAVMRASADGRELIANDKVGFVSLMRASKAAREVIANSSLGFKMLMQANVVGRGIIISEVARIKPEMAAEIAIKENFQQVGSLITYNEKSCLAAAMVVARNGAPLTAAAIKLISENDRLYEKLIEKFPNSPILPAGSVIEMQSNNSTDPEEKRAANIQRIWQEHPELLVANLTQDEHVEILTPFLKSQNALSKPMAVAALAATNGEAVSSIDQAFQDKIVDSFLKDSSDVEIMALDANTRIKATEATFLSVSPDDDLVASAMNNTSLESMRNKAAEAALNDAACAGQVYDSIDSNKRIAAVRTALSGQESVKAIMSLKATQSLQGALEASINQSDGAAISEASDQVKLNMIKDALNRNGASVITNIKALSGGPDIFSDVMTKIFTNPNTTDADMAVRDMEEDVRLGVTRNAFQATNAEETVKAVKDKNIKVLNTALNSSLQEDGGSAFDVVDDSSPSQTRTKILVTSMLATGSDGIKGGAINALKTDHLATYQKALTAVIELPNPEVQKEINRVLALRTPDSIAANHAIEALAGIVAADDDTINELADILENAQVANAISDIPNTDSEAHKTEKKNKILDPKTRATNLASIRDTIRYAPEKNIQQALAAKPLAALAALNKLHAKTQNSDEHLAILLNGHAESKELIEELIGSAPITAKEISKAREKNPEATQYAIDLALAASNPEFISTALDKHAGANAVMKGQAKRASSVLNDARDNTAVGERNVDLSSGVRKLQTTSVEASPAVAFAAKRIVKALSVLNQDAATTPKMRAAMVLAHPAGIVSNPDAVNALANILVNQDLADDVDKAKALLENPETAAQTIQAVYAKASADVLRAISDIPAAITLAMAATAIRENPIGAYENVKAINQTGLEAAIKNTMIGPANTALSDVEMRAMAKSSYAIHVAILCDNDISIEDKKAIAKLVPSPPAIGVLLSARRDFALKLLQDPKTSLATLMAAYAAHPKKTQRAMNALIDNKTNLKSIRETLLAKINNPLDEINGSSAVVAARNQLIANDPAVKLAEANLAELRQRALASLMRKHINANPEVQKARVDVTRYEIVAANFSHFSKAIPELNQVTTADEIASNRETAVKKIAEFFAANHNQRAIVDQQVTARPQLKDAVPEVAAAIRSVDLTPIEAEMQRLEETERFVGAKDILKAAQDACAKTLAKDSTYNAAITAAQTSVFKDAYKNDTSTLLMRQVLHNEGDLSVIKNGARITFADGQWVDITGDAFFEALRKIPTHLSDDLKEVISHNEEAVQDIQACIDDKNSNGNNLEEHLVLARKIENVSKAQAERIHKLEGVLEQFLAVTPRERHKAEAEIARLKDALPELEEAHKAVYDNVKANITNARSNAYDRLKGEKTSAVYKAIQGVISGGSAAINELVATPETCLLMANAILNDAAVLDALADYIISNKTQPNNLVSVSSSANKADVKKALQEVSANKLADMISENKKQFVDVVRATEPLRKALANNKSVMMAVPIVVGAVKAQRMVVELTKIEQVREIPRKRNLEAKSSVIVNALMSSDEAWNAFNEAWQLSPSSTVTARVNVTRDAVSIRSFILSATDKDLLVVANATPALKAVIEDCISVAKLDASPEVQAAWKKAIESDPKVVDSSKSLESAKKDLSKANNDLAKLTAKTECLNSSNKVLSKQKNQLAEHGEIVKEQIRELPRRRQALKERIAEADANRIGGRFRPSSG